MMRQKNSVIFTETSIVCTLLVNGASTWRVAHGTWVAIGRTFHRMNLNAMLAKRKRKTSDTNSDL